MSKAETIDALMDSATLIFAKCGYEGASLRDIARGAGVPLSTIHLYFGSKSELFIGVRQAAWDEVNREREALFEDVLAKGQPGDALLIGVLHSLAHPIVRRAMSKKPRDMAQTFLIRAHWNRSPSEHVMALSVTGIYRWLNAVSQCCPTFSRVDSALALSFVVGAIYSWQLMEHHADMLEGEGLDLDADSVTADIVTFCHSGIRAMAARRSPLGNQSATPS
jgi:AcrR family transcriptional regulator